MSEASTVTHAVAHVAACCMMHVFGIDPRLALSMQADTGPTIPAGLAEDVLSAYSSELFDWAIKTNPEPTAMMLHQHISATIIAAMANPEQLRSKLETVRARAAASPADDYD